MELDCSGTDFAALGFEYGDIVTVGIHGYTLEMPIGSNYTDVDDGSYICRMELQSDPERNLVLLAINNSSMAEENRLDLQSTVTVTLKEKAGCLEEYLQRQLTRTNIRADYAQLTDEEYANFRMVETSGIAPYTLYRSSSPIDPWLNRSKEADQALNNAGIAVILNLTDAEEGMRACQDYPGSHYADRAVVCVSLPMDINTEAYRSGPAQALRFLIANEGPYLNHCLEGKDRTVFVCAMLECLMGANIDEITADYI